MTEMQQWHHALKDAEQLGSVESSLPRVRGVHRRGRNGPRGIETIGLDRRQRPILFWQVCVMSRHLQLHIWLHTL